MVGPVSTPGRPFVRAHPGASQLTFPHPAVRRPDSPEARLARLGAAGDDGDRPPVLRPTLFGIAQRHRALLAIGNCRNPAGIDALGEEEFARRRGPTGGKRDVVLAGAALVGVALDLDHDTGILGKPGGLLAQRLLGLGRQCRLVLGEVDAVADIDGEILLGPRLGRAGAGIEIGRVLLRTGRQRQKTGLVLGTELEVQLRNSHRFWIVAKVDLNEMPCGNHIAGRSPILL